VKRSLGLVILAVVLVSVLASWPQEVFVTREGDVRAANTSDYVFNNGIRYAPGEEIVGQRGRSHRVFYEGDDTYKAEFTGSPEFTKANGQWVDYVFTEYEDYYQVQHPWSSARFYDYYTEVWDEGFTEVKIHDDRWVVEYLNKQGKWRDTGLWNITRSYEAASDGIKVRRTGNTDIGQREEEYFFRNGSPCKISIKQTCDEAQTIRFVWKPSGIVSATERNIVEEFGEHEGRISGLNYYDSNGKFVETIRWYDALNSTDDIDVVAEASAQGRKATVTFGGFAINAGGIAHLDPSTFYPDADPETKSVDGYARSALRAGGGTWDGVHDDPGDNANDTSIALTTMIRGYDADEWYLISRTLILFDTSDLPDNALITNATLSLYGYSKQEDWDIDYDVNIYSSAPASNTEIVAGDYDSLGTIPYCAAAILIDNWNIGDPGTINNFVLNPAGIAAIDKTGVSKFGFRSATHDAGDSEPSLPGDASRNQIEAFSADKGTGYKPQIVVTFIIPPTVTTSAATSVEETTATLNGNITATGGENAGERGFDWDTDSGTPYSGNWTEAGSFGTGAFTHGLTSLTKGDLYYFRAKAHNSAGWGYGSELTFLTKPDPATSFVPTDNGTTWISLGWTNGTGMDYVTVRYAEGSAPSDNVSGDFGYWGSGTSCNVTGLSPGTTYHFVIFTYATEGGLWSTSDNSPTCQGDTAVAVPTVTNGVGATNVTDNDARLNGEVTDNGGENPTVTVFWGTVDGATTPASWSDNASLGVQGVGTFYHDITDNLTASTLYYYRMRAVNSGGTDWANSSANFTTTTSALQAPTYFTLADLGGITVSANWTKGVNTTYTMIRFKRDSYPTTVSNGELVYYGDGTTDNFSGYSLETTTYYFSAWGFDSDNISHSDDYAQASIGGEAMEEIATQLGNWVTWLEGDFLTLLQTILSSVIGLFLVLAITALAFWQRNVFLYLLAAPVNLVYGLSTAASSVVNSAMWVIGVIIAIIGTFCLFRVALDQYSEIKSRARKRAL